jgi:RNA methyltransferase, TrmH family
MESSVAKWSVQWAKIQILKHPIIFFIFAFIYYNPMISSAQIKLIRSLSMKKYRERYRLFMVEGEKMVLELLTGGPDNQFHLRELFATGEWIRNHERLLNQLQPDIHETTMAVIKKVSNLVTPQPVIALVSIPEYNFSMEMLLQKPVLAFDAIRDPGNLGTIIRTADWFGISQIVCTPDSTDLYNPKVVQSTMGAIARVRVDYLELEDLLKSTAMKEKVVYGTFLQGENIYQASIAPDPLILFGNESHGLSGRYNAFIRKKISIPSFSRSGEGSESLNIASSVAVVCSELRRR